LTDSYLEEMASSVSKADMVAAFLRVAQQKRRSHSVHGKWIPICYWADLVNREIHPGAVKPSKLYKALEDCGCFVTTASNNFDYGCVEAIFGTEARVKRRRASLSISATKKRQFLCIETSETKADELPTNNNIKAVFFHEQYLKYARASIIEPAVATRATEGTANVAAKSMLSNDDVAYLKNLFAGIINDKYLSCDDLFVEANRTVINEQIERVGRKLQEERNKLHYKIFYQSPAIYKRKDIKTLDPSNHPVLTNRFGIPLTVPAIQDIGKAILNIADDVPEVLEFPKFGGSRGKGNTLVTKIVPSSTEVRLYANAKRWMPCVLEAAVENDSPLAKYHVVSVLMKVLATIDSDAFNDVCRAKHRDVHQRIDPLLQKALVFDAHLAQNQLKLIQKYTIYALGYNIWQPIPKMVELDAEVFPAVRVPFVENNMKVVKRRVCHYRPIDKLLKWKLDRVLRNTSTPLRFSGASNPQKLDSCHVIFGGDHGQKAFRAVVTILIFSKGTVQKFNLEYEEDFLCGFIECKKDTYGVVESTIAKPLNESLKRIRDAEELVFCKAEDGNLFVEWGAAAAAAATHADGATIVRAIPVELFLVGDLAFQLLAQGRDGMAAYWCPRCQWGWSDWQCLQCGEPTTGESWTLESMSAKLFDIRQAEAAGRKVYPQTRRGVTEKTLFDSISFRNFLAPVLHAVDLFLNTAKDMLDSYIDYRLEDRPIAMVNARWHEADMKIAERKALAEVESAEQELLDATLDGDADTVKNATAALTEATSAHKAAKKSFGAAAAARRKLEKAKEHGALTQDLRQEVDALLADLIHVLRAAWHGGDMVGGHCRKLMRCAAEAMDALVALLISVPRDQRAAGCDDDEVLKYCEAFKRLFQYFDLLSHFCYQPYGSITDSEMHAIKSKLVPYMDRLWRKLSRNVQPKVHAWQHLVQDLDRLRGMKHHQEAKIEIAHQIGKRTELRFRALAGSIDKKIKCAMKYQANLHDPATRAMQELVRVERSRKLGEKTKARNQLKEADSKRRKHEHLESILTLPEILEDFPSLLELTVRDRQAV